MGHGAFSAFSEAVLGFPVGSLPAPDDPSRIALLAGLGTSPDPKVPSVADAMAAVFASIRKPLLQTWFWPDAKPFAVSLSHDVDEVHWSWRRRLLMTVRHPRAERTTGDPYWNFDKVLDLERRHGVRSSWYFVADGADPRDPPYRLREVADEIRRLEAYGQEIGVHGSFLSYRDPAMLKRERDAMAGLLGHPIPGVRQHLINFDGAVTWRAQQHAGFNYDATLGLNEASGFRTGMCHPYVPPGHTILEIPLIIMDRQLFSQERLTTALAIDNCERLAEKVAMRGGLLTLNWHQHTLDAESFPGWWDVYVHMLEWLTMRGPAFLTGEEVWRWWTRRAAVTVTEVENSTNRVTWTVRSPEAITGLTVRPLVPGTVDVSSDVEHRVVTRGTDTFLVFKELTPNAPAKVTAKW